MNLPLPSPEDEAYPIIIRHDGSWWHEGAPIERPALLRLFASVLSRDAAGDTWLVTKAERGRIVVEDVPFIAVAANIAGAGVSQQIELELNYAEAVRVSASQPLQWRPYGGALVPYVRVRGEGALDDPLCGLWARCSRGVYYQLMQALAINASGEAGLWADGQFYAMPALLQAGNAALLQGGSADGAQDILQAEAAHEN